MSRIPQVRRLRDGEREVLREALASDDHTLLPATHVVIKNGEIVGCFMVNYLVTWWMHSGKTNARDSLIVRNILWALLDDKGLTDHFVVVGAGSNYEEAMPSLGGRYPSKGTLWHVQIGEGNG